jgi:hypothetical protein
MTTLLIVVGGLIIAVIGRAALDPRAAPKPTLLAITA